MSTKTHVIVLTEGATVQDVARALEFTGLAISNTFDPNVFVIKPAQRRLPENVVPFSVPAFLRKQAE